MIEVCEMRSIDYASNVRVFRLMTVINNGTQLLSILLIHIFTKILITSPLNSQ